MPREILLVPSDEPSAAARIGGTPTLPPDMAWPAHRWPLTEVATWPDYARAELEAARATGAVFDEDGHVVMPLPFLAQVDLGVLAHGDARLPATGALLFFADQMTTLPDARFAKRVASTVVYVARLADAPPRDHPVTVEPPPTNIRWLRAEPVDEPRDETHAFLPAPQEELAGPMPPSGHVALLRLHDDPEVGLYVGDAAWLTFVIAEDDLRAQRFANACASVFVG